jgi:hypothetical protein
LHRHVPNGVGHTVPRVRFPLGGGPPGVRSVTGGRVSSRPWVPRPAWAVRCPRRSLWSSRGRCRPSPSSQLRSSRGYPIPDGVPEGASPDSDARGIVPGGGASWGGQRSLPVLRAPQAGAGRVDRHDRQAGFGIHGGDTDLEFSGGHAGDELPEASFAAVLLTGLVRREVQVLDGDAFTPIRLAQLIRRVRAWRSCASRWPAVRDRS